MTPFLISHCSDGRDELISTGGRLCLKSRNLLLDTVSTTCDSGWVRSLYACIGGQSPPKATHPPAIAGGTDCVQHEGGLIIPY